jgi:hypothetical protein
MSLLETFPQNFEFKRLIPLEKIKVADISIILQGSQKCVIDKIEEKRCLVKIKRDYVTVINKNVKILAQTRSYFNILMFCPPISHFPKS